MALIPVKKSNHLPALGILRDEIDSLFHLPHFPVFTKEMFTPSLDMWDDKDNIYVETDIPGVGPKDIKVNVKGNFLIISANKSESREEKKKIIIIPNLTKGIYTAKSGHPRR